MTAPSDSTALPTPVAVGVARTPYDGRDAAPHQGFAAADEATIEIFEPYADALAGIEECLRVTVVYWADRADRDALVDEDGIGAFAKRTPNRPNPLGICTCLLLDRRGRELRVRGLDAFDGSPILDVKPALQAER